MKNILSSYISEDMQQTLQTLLVSFVLWNILNIIAMKVNLPDKHLPRNDWLDLRNRIVSIVHGTTLIFASGYNTYFAKSSCGEYNTNFETNLIQFSNGYFLYDLIAMAYLGLLDTSMFIHHLICLGGYTGGLMTGRSADVLVAAMFFTEISNPYMHFRIIMKHLGKRYTRAYETSEITYMSNDWNVMYLIVLYMFGRVCLGLPVLYSTLVCPYHHWITKVTAVGLIGFSMYFMPQMVSILK